MKLIRDSRREGVALVLVLVFAAGTVVLVSALLTLATMGVTDESERHDLKRLHAVLRAGAESAIAEVNLDRLYEDGYDPDDDGPGTLLTGPDGLMGFPITAANGQTLGRYRTIVSDDGSGLLTLTVVAAYPSFESEHRRLVGAQMSIDPGTPPFLYDRNALSVVGAAGDTLHANVSNGAKVLLSDPSFERPAVNISSEDFYNEFLSEVASKAKVDIVGGDPDNPGSPATGGDSVTNLGEGVISENGLQQILTSITDYVAANEGTAATLANAIAALGGTVDLTGGGNGEPRVDSSTNVTLPEGVYTISDLEVKGTITGSGTLIIKDGDDEVGLNIESGGRLNWNGNIIVLGEGGEIEVRSGGRLDVTDGVLALVTTEEDGYAELEVDGGGRLDVTGSLLSLGEGSDADQAIDLRNGSEIYVQGILALLGEDMDLDLQSRLEVEGSVVFGIPEDADDPHFDLRLDGGSEWSAIFNNANFENGLEELGQFFDLTGVDETFPVELQGYWEAGGAQLFEYQELVLAGSGPDGEEIYDGDE